MYFEFDDVRRIHQPYTDNYTRGKSLIVTYLRFQSLFGRLQPIIHHISTGKEECML